MTKDEILEKFKEYFYDEIGSAITTKEKIYESIHYDANVMHDLHGDDLDHWEFFLRLEEEFNIDMPEEPHDEFVTVRQVVDYIHDKQHSKTTIR